MKSILYSLGVIFIGFGIGKLIMCMMMKMKEKKYS